MGPIGALWIATCMALGRDFRAPKIHTEVAGDVLDSLRRKGRLRYIGTHTGQTGAHGAQ